MSEPLNDDGVSLPTPNADAPNAHGEAALILVESLIHGLLARSGLSLDEAIEIARTAVEVQGELSDGRGGDTTAPPTSGHLLSAIYDSLGRDAGHKLD